MDIAKYIQETKTVLQRIKGMKDKVKALGVLNQHETKWEPYEPEIIRQISLHTNTDVEELYSDILFYSLKLSQSLDEAETVRYANTLSNEILEPDWCKKQDERLKSIYASLK